MGDCYVYGWRRQETHLSGTFVPGQSQHCEMIYLLYLPFTLSWIVALGIVLAGRFQNLGSYSARGKFFSGQTFEDESGSQSKEPNVDSSESSTPQESNAAPESDAASESNAAPELFSFGNPAVSELPHIGGGQLNQDSPAVSELPDSGGGQLNQDSPAVTELPDIGGGQLNQVQAESLERRPQWASGNYAPRSTYSPRGVYKVRYV